MASFAAQSVFRSATSFVRCATARVLAGAKPRASHSPFRASTQKLLPARIFRSSAEMRTVSVASMLPYHTATASAVLTSMLSVAPRTHAWTLEDGVSSSEGKMAAATQINIKIQSPHILVVDDKRISRLYHSSLFKKFACNVTIVESGLQAMEFLDLVDDKGNSGNHTHIIPKVNLICTYYHMPPGMNGYDLLKKIKESPATKDVPVVIISSDDADTNRINECLEAGAKMFNSKPLNSADARNILKLMYPSEAV